MHAHELKPQKDVKTQKTFLAFGLLLIALLGIHLFTLKRWWFPAPAALHAASIDRQFLIALWFLGALFIAAHLLFGAVIFRSRTDRPAAYTGGNWRFEITWTVLIAALFFWFNISGAQVWSEINSHQSATDPVQVEVTGAQFQWYFRYPGPDGTWGRTDAQKFAKASEGNPLGIDPDDPAGKDDIVSGSLVLPVNRDVNLILRAQDVIHSVFIPAMRFKLDAVPGMEIRATLKPLQTGTFEMACSQLCGLGHYRMRAVVKVVSEEDFKQWLKKSSR